MLDYCVYCARSVNTDSDPGCYAIQGVCLCAKCREQASIQGPGRDGVHTRDREVPLDGRMGLAEGIVSLERKGVTYRGHWATLKNRIFVYWGLKEDSALLGMFDKEPETLARVLLFDMVSKELAKHHATPKEK